MKIEQDVMVVLSNLVVDKNTVVIKQKLDRAMYTKVNKVLEALEGKWNTKAKAHIFPGDAAIRVDAAIIAGAVLTKADIGFFPTPPELAIWLVGRLNVKPGEVALEPSAGTGNIVHALLEAGAKVNAVERDEKMRKALQSHANLGARHENLVAVADSDDFMFYHRDPQPKDRLFDVVAMNPPFLKVGESDHLGHVRHAFDLLKAGGRLGAILPSGVTFREDRRHTDFRNWVNEHGCLEGLAPFSFRASGTDVNTVVAFMTKQA